MIPDNYIFYCRKVSAATLGIVLCRLLSDGYFCHLFVCKVIWFGISILELTSFFFRICCSSCILTAMVLYNSDEGFIFMCCHDWVWIVWVKFTISFYLLLWGFEFNVVVDCCLWFNENPFLRHIPTVKRAWLSPVNHHWIPFVIHKCRQVKMVSKSPIYCVLQ